MCSSPKNAWHRHRAGQSPGWTEIWASMLELALHAEHHEWLGLLWVGAELLARIYAGIGELDWTVADVFELAQKCG